MIFKVFSNIIQPSCARPSQDGRSLVLRHLRMDWQGRDLGQVMWTRHLWTMPVQERDGPFAQRNPPEHRASASRRDVHDRPRGEDGTRARDHEDVRGSGPDQEGSDLASRPGEDPGHRHSEQKVPKAFHGSGEDPGGDQSGHT